MQVRTYSRNTRMNVWKLMDFYILYVHHVCTCVYINSCNESLLFSPGQESKVVNEDIPQGQVSSLE